MSDKENKRWASDADSSRTRKRPRRDTSNDPNYFVFTSKTKLEDIPRRTMTHLRVDSSVRKTSLLQFQNCIKLVKVQLPDTLVLIDFGAFAGCSNLQSVQFVTNNGRLITFIRKMDDRSLVFPDSGKKLVILSNAFSGCTSLQKLVCSPRIDIAGDLAFSGCTGLVSVELPETLQIIMERLFLRCESLVSIKMPSSLLAIRNSAFKGCKSLTTFQLPVGLLAIGTNCFRECVSLESLELPATTFRIGRLAFMGCSALKHIQLSSTLKILEYGVFEDCSSLEYIEIPKSVTEIKRWAFSGCSSLSHLRIPPRVTIIERHAFNNCTNLLSLELPEGLETAQLVFAEEEMGFEAECEDDILPCGDPDYEEYLLPARDRIFDPDSLNDFCGIYGCSSLVNLLIPENQDCDDFEDDRHLTEAIFMKNLMFGRVLDGYDDLVDSLKYRFHELPLHRLCYYQSYHRPTKAMGQLKDIVNADPSAIAKVDKFGMTPLHVLALSQTPNQRMLLALLKDIRDPLHCIRARDSFGSTPMDYLCRSRVPDSSLAIRRMFQHIVFRTWWLNPWQSEILLSVSNALCMDWYSRMKEIERTVFQIAIYEWVETLSLIELFLWKVKMNEVGTKDAVDRQSCRISSGASVVLSHVVPFLDKLNPKDYECTHQPPDGAQAPSIAAPPGPSRHLAGTLSILDYYLPINP